MTEVITITPLYVTIMTFIRENGGAENLTDLILSENSEYFKHEAVQANLRLSGKRLTSDGYIRPFKRKLASDRAYQAIKYMYPHYSYKEMAQELGKSVNYVIYAVYRLIKDGKMERVFPLKKTWTEDDVAFLLQNKDKNNQEIADALGRTLYAIAKRKSIDGVLMEEQHKQLAGRRAHKHYI